MEMDYTKLSLEELNKLEAELLAKQGPKEEAPKKMSMTDQFMHQLGLLPRIGVEGLTGIANVFANPLAYTLNKITGSNAPLPSQGVSQALTKLGLPEFQPGLEQFLAGPAEALVAASPSKFLAGLGPLVTRGPVGKVSPTATPTGVAAREAPLLAPLGEKLGIQAQGAVGGATAAEGAKAAGAGPVWQFIASQVGGLAAPAGIGAAKMGGRAAVEGIRPLREKGQDQVVGTSMYDQLHDPKAAMANLENVPEYVPGSQPTTGQASRDIGLLGAERGVQRMSPGTAILGEQQLTNNQARMDQLRTLPASEQALALADMLRDQAADPIRENAFAKAKPVDISSVEKMIYDLGNASKDNTLIQKFGELMSKLDADPRGVYGTRMLIDKWLRNIPENNSLDAWGKKQLMMVKNQIDVVLNKATKGEFGKYLDTYKDMSKAVDQAKASMEILDKFSKTQVDLRGNPQLSPYALKSAVEGVQNPVTKGGAETIFTPAQMNMLQRVIADLDRAALSNSSAVRPAGSNTFQDMASGNLVNRSLGGGIAQNALFQAVPKRILDFLYSQPEKRMQDLNARGYADPKLGLYLMKQRLPPKDQITLDQLLNNAGTASYGGLLGDLSQR
jgi:hypothetical protein